MLAEHLIDVLWRHAAQVHQEQSLGEEVGRETLGQQVGCWGLYCWVAVMGIGLTCLERPVYLQGLLWLAHQGVLAHPAHKAMVTVDVVET